MDNPIMESLEDKLKKESLTPLELRDGMTECFVITNRQFMQKRMGSQPSLDKIDATTKELVDLIYSELGVTPGVPTRQDLQQAWARLDTQLGFEAAPELLAQHRQIIQKLFDLADVK